MIIRILWKTVFRETHSKLFKIRLKLVFLLVFQAKATHEKKIQIKKDKWISTKEFSIFNVVPPRKKVRKK